MKKTSAYWLTALFVALPLWSQVIPVDHGQFICSDNNDTTTVVMRFGGDCLLAEHYVEAVGDSVHHAFADFDLFRSADLAMVNLECPVTTRGKKVPKPFNFRMNPGHLAVLTEAGIDIVNIANNHIYDYGSVGLFDTIEHLDHAGLKYVGAGRNKAEAHRPLILESKGWRIAFFGYYGGPEAPAATISSAGVASRRIGLIEKDVRSIRQTVEYIVVNLHWGTEKATRPDRDQIKFARRIIESGADAVIGHHPHVLQGIERYKNGVIAYSLGNLVFGGNSRSNYETGIFEITLGRDEISYRFIPVSVKDWRVELADEATAAATMGHVASLSRLFPKTIFHSDPHGN
jgi:poly-gamma-glutamate capsule biosynthesis protein CapA/YwtB (metallophosphatase superfamily)